MRYLNKIVFINSAHIPLAEVKLDGNVHFIGTQGVGKSTLLRAILFFYNADKQRLGIPKEKSTFDSYYFPYSNSYIVYEVMRENGAYCVVTAKSQGRVFFRFIDAPYNREWFTDENNLVYNDWNRIREHIDKSHFVSAQVTSYEMYRDIIFGNNRRSDLTSYRKFAIVESAKYQNIPRTIQNVFLNTKLDADFIKDTIIQSMSDEEVGIDLEFYRNQIKSFEQEYSDVMRWFTKNTKGEILVRKQAERVINTYRDLLYTQKEIIEAKEELNYAGRAADEERPLLQDKIERKSEEERAAIASINDLSDKYNKERDKLNKDLGGVQNVLSSIRQKQQHYEHIKIKEIIARVEQEDKHLKHKKQLEELKLGLMSAFNDVEQKYKLLIDNIESDFSRFKMNCKSQIQERNQLKFNRKEEILNEQREQEEEIRVSYEDRLISINNKITEILVLQEAEKRKLNSLSMEDPFRKEKADCNKEIELLDRKSFDLQIDIDVIKTKVIQLRQEHEQKKKEIDWANKEATDLYRKERAELKMTQESVVRLIDKRSGSLCEWLDQNKKGWRDNIGRIAEEETILYSRELNPSISAESDSLFGVKLDLTNISRNIRTPEDLNLEKEQIQSAIDDCAKRHENLLNEYTAKVAEIDKKYALKIREQNSLLHQKEAEKSQIPNKIKSYKAELTTLERKENDWRNEQRDIIKSKQAELAHTFIETDTNKKTCLEERDRKINTCKKKNQESIRELEKSFKEFEAERNNEIEAARDKLNKEKANLSVARQQELAGKGADVQTIERYESEIEGLIKELDFIKGNRVIVFEFEKDKRELFDNEVSHREQEKRLKAKLEDLKNNFKDKKTRLESKLNELRNLLSQMKTDLGTIESGLKQKKEFFDNQIFCPVGSEVIRERVTRKDCLSIIADLKDKIYSTNSKMEEFKKSVNLFKGNFSAKNTFHFNMELITEANFFDFASNLCEFVENDKISEYQRLISERYVDIIRRISKEVGDLTIHESEIIRTIKEINDDFNKRNFAGVIKEISLQADNTKDKIVQLLIEVKRFNDENQFNMGVVDLFSQEEAARNEINAKAIEYLLAFMKYLLDDPNRKQIALSDTFQLKFRVKENDNDTGWIEKISNVGSEGTDVLVKAMVNIMLINVFKEKASRKFGEFKLHCMMDEIGKLHPNNVKGILEFANSRNILLINSSPTTFNAADYRHTYLLSKDGHSHTQVTSLLTNTLR